MHTAFGRFAQGDQDRNIRMRPRVDLFISYLPGFKKAEREMTYVKTSQKCEVTVAMALDDLSAHMKLWLNAISHGSQWVNTKRMVEKKIKQHCLCSCCLCQVASASISIRLLLFKTIQGRGKQKEQNPAFTDDYINTDDRSKVPKSEWKWAHPPDKTQGFVHCAGRSCGLFRSAGIFSRD